MRMVRERLIALVLTLVVGLALASSAFAHRVPTSGDLQLQTLAALGLTEASLCGEQTDGKGPAPCAEAGCVLCAPASAPGALAGAAVWTMTPSGFAPVLRPDTAAALRPAAAIRPPSRAPPVSL